MRTVGTTGSGGTGECISTEKHLIQEYRVRFETFFDTRYDDQPRDEADLLPFIIPFLHALGFHHTKGPRYVKMTDDPFQTLDNVCRRVVYWKKAGRLNRIERKAAASCAAAAMLYTLGHNETDRYLDIEKAAVLLYRVDIERIRINAKDAFTHMMSRFDQYMTCSPIAPIYWSRINSSVVPKRIGAKEADARPPQVANTPEEAREWLR